VALESTIISHGMPYPENVKTAREVEEIVRANGAVPATIAVIAGKIRIGLSPEEIEFLGGATAGHGSTDASGSRAAEIPASARPAGGTSP
jgi:pseudouridine-5'-phosphate glycosidase